MYLFVLMKHDMKTKKDDSSEMWWETLLALIFMAITLAGMVFILITLDGAWNIDREAQARCFQTADRTYDYCRTQLN